ncbi:RHS repeat-associated core domain-containing protein, partial [Flavobacterium sp. T12S277]
GDTELTVKEEFTYSPQDRLLTHTHQVNGGTVEVLASNTYDDLGQLIVKNVGNSAANPLQKVHYSYNIRGWLTEINNVDNLQPDTDPVDLFAFKINYNKQPGNSQVQALYNGNISETTWKTNTDVTKRSYGYQYDKLNRLTSAIYSKPNDAIAASGAYNESLSYDKNGNIKSLQRYGASDAPSIAFQIDDLTYGYLNENSNLLTKVTDSPAGNDNEGFKDGNKTDVDFTYDANGNMITDKNKNITEIQYNQLNLPKKITFGTSGSIVYIYNAAGQKLEKIVSANETVTKTDYLDGFQYNYINYGGQVPDDPGN